MKKALCVILLLIMLLTIIPLGASAALAKEKVLSTDIGCLVNMQPIYSFNVNNETYVVAEDLRSYGFDVVWEAKARTLSITSNNIPAQTILSKEQINILKTDIKTGVKLFDVYKTNIKTYIAGSEVVAYNINGYTLIKLADLSVYGYLEWDKDNKIASINVLQKSLDEAYEKAEKSEVIIKDYPLSLYGCLPTDVTYIGEVAGGVPNGIGKIHYDPGVVYDAAGAHWESYLGYFRDGKKDGRGIYRMYDRLGANRANSQYGEENYSNGLRDGYNITCFYSTLWSQTVFRGRKEGLYLDDKLNSPIVLHFDASFKFGFEIE